MASLAFERKYCGMNDAGVVVGSTRDTGHSQERRSRQTQGSLHFETLQPEVFSHTKGTLSLWWFYQLPFRRACSTIQEQ
jgi:hypothetical protein